MNRRKGLLLTGGGGPERSRIEPWLDEVAMVIAADSGYDLAQRVGVEPDLIVGDFDSISNADMLLKYDDGKVKRYSVDKDESDTEIGLRLLHEAGIADIVIAGGGGGRLDHLIAMLCLFDRPEPPIAWLTDGAEIRCIDERVVFDGTPGETLSFFPVGPEPCRMRSTGLRWPLDGLTWRKGDVGLSNVLTEESAIVEMESGRLISVRLWRR